jgi:glycerol-3-phosphate dehydrogenase
LEPVVFNRDVFIKKLSGTAEWDIVVIGGGATGLGVAVDAAARGFRVLLLEQVDFAKGTSGRSTKLVHGGVRYLAQGNIKLVYGALHERGLLLKNAAHLVKKQHFVIPCYNSFSVIKYFVGLKLYDWLSGKHSFGKSGFLSKEKVVALIPGINKKGLAGGIEYFDGQFDDARLAVNLAQTCAEKGGVVLNYCKVTGLLKSQNNITGVIATDTETNTEYHLRAKVVVNATGVFVDDIMQMDMPEKKPLVRPSQGVHIVLDRSFLNGSSAVMIPKTSDGRVLFAIPWHEHVLIGTTDTPLHENSLEPRALEQEISFILDTVKQYWSTAPQRKDILSVFAGLRPLAAPQKETGSTKEISRDHKLIVSESGLITITGGKWTTYRKMAEDTVNKAIQSGKLSTVACNTRHTTIHGCLQQDVTDPLSIYGTDAALIRELATADTTLSKKLIDHLPDIEAEVVWAVRNEMARTVEDVLARRMRILFLDARAALQIAPRVASVMASELRYTKEWEQQQVTLFNELAHRYLPDSNT